MTKLCSVCEKCDGAAGGLMCEHKFCHDCFNRYVCGSLDELNSYLRCCICGKNSILTYETKNESICFKFGRETLPKLADATGIAQNNSGDFVMVDKCTKRVYLFDCLGTPIHDFAYLHSTQPQGGIAVNKNNEIVIPLHNGKYSCLAFYTQDGSFLSSTYFPDAKTYVEGIAVNSKNRIIVTDSKTGSLHIFDSNKRHAKVVKLESQSGEVTPAPCGVAIGENDDLYITDIANNCVKVLDAQGVFNFSFGSLGERPRQFRQPSGIVIDEEGRVVVADRGNHRAQYFTKYGEFLKFIVRYNRGEDVYMAPQGVVPWGAHAVALLLTSTREAPASEVRIYKEWV